ncbi:Fe(2+)-dependent GTP cyclohydrolase MptA [Methanonatronarchaeum thermophilum]|uniref:GTP cyclohydrolase MptA n=1 Tax=Methanonatronarchaeum thermophilum TaxID=1927129 RepID=A0A1Y3GDZ2_9EURY|nr:GTP cyclohydrolase MptA [Methanonatronarchaeum thermophilum]OUJ19437.1 Fe(2+)-dependent GTP cyclohydrolase MptA [Methanonatronarchaeum thermophilum]
MTLPDVQADKPSVPVDLTRVGVSNIRKHVELRTEGSDRPMILLSEFNISVDLPSDRKGANLSRNFEAIDEVLERAVEEPVCEIESLCVEVAKEILERHEYANRAEVNMESEFSMKKKAPVSEIASQDIIKIFARAVATPEGVRNRVGTEVKGTTACPCAQGIMAENIREVLQNLDIPKSKADTILKEIPIATHNQRGRGSISIEVPVGYEVPIEKLVEIIERSMSSRIYELLKREDEAEVVEKAHKNPVFVEDAVRNMIAYIVEEFPNLPDNALITARQINEESIHSHNAFAERAAEMGELRKEVK